MTFVSSGNYTFYVKEESVYDYNDEGDEVETDSVILYALSVKRQPFPCVKIELSKNKKYPIAELQTLNFYTSCSVKKPLDKSIGTIRMIQTLLLYTIKTYPHITSVELQDETFIDVPGKPLITPRRLLMGEKGWYEASVGALPKKPVLGYHLHFLRLPSTQQKVKALLPPEATHNLWWVPERIKEVADKLKEGLFAHLIGSQWTIPASTIRAYDIPIEVTSATLTPAQTGGFQRKLKRVYQRAPLNYVSHHWVGR